MARRAQSEKPPAAPEHYQVPNAIGAPDVPGVVTGTLSEPDSSLAPAPQVVGDAPHPEQLPVVEPFRVVTSGMLYCSSTVGGTITRLNGKTSFHQAGEYLKFSGEVLSLSGVYPMRDAQGAMRPAPDDGYRMPTFPSDDPVIILPQYRVSEMHRKDADAAVGAAPYEFDDEDDEEA